MKKKKRGLWKTDSTEKGIEDKPLTGKMDLNGIADLMSEGDVQYFYNVGKMMNGKKVYVELGNIMYTAIPLIVSGFKELRNHHVTFYYRDVLASDAMGVSSIKSKMEQQSLTVPLSDFEGPGNFEDKNIDILFLRGEKKSL